MPEVLDEEKEIRMSEERKKDEDVERLKKELNEWIDPRIADNNAFISSPKKETLSLLFALLSLLAICGSWLWGILKQYSLKSEVVSTHK